MGTEPRKGFVTEHTDFRIRTTVMAPELSSSKTHCDLSLEPDDRKPPTPKETQPPKDHTLRASGLSVLATLLQAATATPITPGERPGFPVLPVVLLHVSLMVLGTSKGLRAKLTAEALVSSRRPAEKHLGECATWPHANLFLPNIDTETSGRWLQLGSEIEALGCSGGSERNGESAPA